MRFNSVVEAEEYLVFVVLVVCDWLIIFSVARAGLDVTSQQRDVLSTQCLRERGNLSIVALVNPTFKPRKAYGFPSKALDIFDTIDDDRSPQYMSECEDVKLLQTGTRLTRQRQESCPIFFPLTFLKTELQIAIKHESVQTKENTNGGGAKLFQEEESMHTSEIRGHHQCCSSKHLSMDSILLAIRSAEIEFHGGGLMGEGDDTGDNEDDEVNLIKNCSSSSCSSSASHMSFSILLT
uniref:Uncharacterized protein n=1 Tax=Timema poppense TaxID=170557 RepID=A0A7R9D780_TIMPO|nr:unnamed protein product [Timema poppensis]